MLERTLTHAAADDGAGSPAAGGSGIASFLVLSAATRIRTTASLNHRVYADRHGLDCLFDATPSVIRTALDQKAAAVLRALPYHEWVLWMDDDAFFTNIDIDIRTFITDDADLVICRSPVNPEGGWTFVTFGQFLVRGTPAMIELFEAVAATDLDTVREWWDHDRYGLFTNTDQDALVFQLARDEMPWAGRWTRLDWTAFNSRPYHFERCLDEHLVCHFPGVPSKMDAVRDFASRMQTSTALVDPRLLEPYRAFIDASELAELLGPSWSDTVGELRT